MKNQTSLLVKSKKEGGEKMKKSLLMIAAALLFAAPAMAGISSTKHNLGNTGTGGVKTTGGTSEICIFCHTPHNAGSAGPLWNRATISVTGTYGSPTLNNVPSLTYLNSATAVAPLCLSCHDGSTALGSVLQSFGKSMTIDAMTGSAALGTDMSNDHPVGMIYNDAADTSPYGTPGLRAAQANFPYAPTTGPQTGWFRTYLGNNYMDCSSCHDVHGKDGNAKFLRRSNASSNFCITCHIK